MIFSLDPQDHPRIRGEHGGCQAILVDSDGSSPHTRGARKLLRGNAFRGGIIPAYAGSTCVGPPGVVGPGDHPRIRGEHWPPPPPVPGLPGSSPHTRGARADEPRHRRRVRIIPAYAGSTRGGASWTGRHRDHPRIRGEHMLVVSRLHLIPGSSPHTRGAHQSRRGLARRRRIIPAYAGSTPLDVQAGLTWEDHPRIRGEHSWSSRRLLHGAGSSPHTRGARTNPRPERRRDGIIPAYAGSTRRRRGCRA